MTKAMLPPHDAAAPIPADKSAAGANQDAPSTAAAVKTPAGGGPTARGAIGRFLRRAFWLLIDLAALCVAAVALAGYFGRLAWPCELASHFRLQYGACLATAALLYGVGRHWRRTLACGLLAAANLVLIISPGSVPPRPDDRPVVRAMLSNVLAKNEAHQPVLDYVQAANPDIIVFVEVTYDWAEALHALDVQYPYRRLIPARRSWGMALFSRLPLEDLDVRTLGETDSVALVARLKVGGQPLTLIGAHPFSPVSPTNLKLRNQQYEALAGLVHAHPGPLVLIGDLNSSPWSPYFQDLLSATQLRDSRQGFGNQASWPSKIPLMGIPIPLIRIPIDHCLVSRQIAVHDRQVGPDVGSDHFPVVVDFSVWPEDVR